MLGIMSEFIPERQKKSRKFAAAESVGMLGMVTGLAAFVDHEYRPLGIRNLTSVEALDWFDHATNFGFSYAGVFGCADYANRIMAKILHREPGPLLKRSVAVLAGIAILAVDISSELRPDVPILGFIGTARKNDFSDLAYGFAGVGLGIITSFAQPAPEQVDPSTDNTLQADVISDILSS